MRAIAASIPFALITMLCWGIYGPVLRTGSGLLDRNHWLPFIAVGLAYVVIAILVPTGILVTKGDSGKWTMRGTIWSLAAGCCGAVGALGIILSFVFGGSPLYVMPLVFGSAPVVNTLVSMWMTKTFGEAGPVFFAGIALVALGAAGVFFFAPKATPPAKAEVAATADAESATDSHDASHADDHHGEATTLLGAAGNTVVVFLSIALTGLCWGSYGSVLHKGTHLLGDSRLRALLCVGISYFVLAVIVPVVVLTAESHVITFSGKFFQGMGFSMVAGAAGAIGALGLILAFNFGGKPVFVMPLVFGGAPVINTFVKMWADSLWDKIGPLFFVSLGLVIAGAVTVLVFSPKPKKKGGAAPKKEPKAKKEKQPPASPTAQPAASPQTKIDDADKIPDHESDAEAGDPPALD